MNAISALVRVDVRKEKTRQRGSGMMERDAQDDEKKKKKKKGEEMGFF
jgi:hypothetical protein